MSDVVSDVVSDEELLVDGVVCVEVSDDVELLLVEVVVLELEVEVSPVEVVVSDVEEDELLVPLSDVELDELAPVDEFVALPLALLELDELDELDESDGGSGAVVGPVLDELDGCGGAYVGGGGPTVSVVDDPVADAEATAGSAGRTVMATVAAKASPPVGRNFAMAVPCFV